MEQWRCSDYQVISLRELLLNTYPIKYEEGRKHSQYWPNHHLSLTSLPCNSIPKLLWFYKQTTVLPQSSARLLDEDNLGPIKLCCRTHRGLPLPSLSKLKRKRWTLGGRVEDEITEHLSHGFKQKSCMNMWVQIITVRYCLNREKPRVFLLSNGFYEGPYLGEQSE